MNELLDSTLCDELCYTINQTDIFIKDPEESKKFNLICAIIDRFVTTVKYINEHQEVPKKENEFINFLVYVSILKDGINTVRKILGLPEKNDNKIFESYYIRDLPNINKEINDDKFFEYFRSLAFAHPFVTDRSIPNAINNQEIQYSPFVLTNMGYFQNDDDSVGVEVYSNERDPFYVSFPFDLLKEYIKWKFEMIRDITAEFEKIIKKKEKVWKKHKVNREQDSIEVLKDAKTIIKERYMDTYILDNLIEYLKCECSLDNNKENVEKYKKAIIDIIPNICDAIDGYKHELIYDVLKNILYPRPEAHPMLHYQLEKIFCHLSNDCSKKDWGLIQAQAFANEFARKWVVIDTKNMSFEEIKLLTSVACYMEYQEQKNKEK